MLRPRLIPCLLVRNGGLVKTVGFGDGKYVGDPLNAVRIFNEKEVDELIVLDIDATAERRSPNHELIRSLAAECRMPLTYGGGIRDVEEAQAIIRMGVEKVTLGAAAAADPSLVTRIAQRIGSQSVAVVMDVKKSRWRSRYEVNTHNGSQSTGMDPVDFARQMQDAGAGEIVVNSIDRDGTMEGYDLGLARSIREAIHVPMTVMGGAGSMEDVKALVAEFGTIGAAAGSMFVFKGKYRAVLINYPRPEEKNPVLMEALESRSKVGRA